MSARLYKADAVTRHEKDLIGLSLSFCALFVLNFLAILMKACGPIYGFLAKEQITWRRGYQYLFSMKTPD